MVFGVLLDFSCVYVFSIEFMLSAAAMLLLCSLSVYLLECR